jgi:glutaredoxin
MTAKTTLFTQPGCLSCELMRVFLEAKGIVFEERNISEDLDARRAMREEYKSEETPMLVVVSGEVSEVIVGFDPAHLDRLLDPVPSSDSVTES